jgi:DNA-binding MarR family transcriptional regulator
MKASDPSRGAGAKTHEPNPLNGLPYLLDQAIARWNGRLGKRLELHGLAFEEWRVLLVTIHKGPLNIRELSNATLVPHSTIGRWLVRMERRGLVRRRILPSDKRAVEVTITSKGRERYRAALPTAMAEYHSALHNFGKEEILAFTDFMRRLSDNLTNHKAT